MDNEKAEGNVSIEEHFKHLEEQIDKLEQGELSLEEAFELYKQGLDEVKDAQKQLDAIEKTMLVLNSRGELEEFE